MLRTSAAGLVWASRVEAATTCPVHPFRCADSRASGEGGDRRSSTTAVRDDVSTLRGVAGVAGATPPVEHHQAVDGKRSPVVPLASGLAIPQSTPHGQCSPSSLRNRNAVDTFATLVVRTPQRIWSDWADDCPSGGTAVRATQTA